MPPAPVTSALRHWRQRRSQGSANDTAASARLASSPVPRKRREEPCDLRKGFFKATAIRKSAHSLRFHKNPCSGSQASRPVRVRTRQHEKLSARFACWRQNKTYGGWHQWPAGPASMYIMRLCTRRGVGYLYIKICFSGPRLHGVPCCIILRYVKSGFGGPPYLWRLLQTAQHGAWQPVSHAPTGYAGCLTAAPRTSIFPSSHPEALAKPDNRTSLRSLRAVTLFASKKSAPRQPFTPCKQVLRGNPMLSNSGKSPCRSTGKANIQIVVRLCRAPASNKPSRKTHP